APAPTAPRSAASASAATSPAPCARQRSAAAPAGRRAPSPENSRRPSWPAGSRSARTRPDRPGCCSRWRLERVQIVQHAWRHRIPYKGAMQRTVSVWLGCAVMCVASLSARADEFWSYWGDGKAELDGYALVEPRYGEPRDGTAVLIYVTEDFSDSARVKA